MSELQAQPDGVFKIVKQIKVDPRIESYRTFFDHAWAERFYDLVYGSKLAEPAFILCMDWKSAANTHILPWVLVQGIIGFWKGYLEGQESAAEHTVWHLTQHLPNAMRDSLSYAKRKQLVEVLNTVRDGMKQERQKEEWEEVVKTPQQMFDEFLGGPGSSELRLGLWGSQRLVYGAIFHAYENFVSRCVGLARDEADYRVFRFSKLIADAKQAFGDETATHCLGEPPVQFGRQIRNALAHQGGKMTDELKAVAHDVEVVDETLQIMPADNWALFAELKKRAYKLAQVAITLPRFRSEK